MNIGIRKIVACRRSVVAIIGMVCCTAIAVVVGVDTSGAVAMICMGVAGANAAQAAISSRGAAPATPADSEEKEK
jgi:hypothetical protein